MTQKGNLAAVCVLVLLLELSSLVPGQQCSSTYQPIPGPPGRDGRDGNDGSPGSNGNDGSAGRNGIDGSPGRDGKDGSPAVFTHEDFLKLKEMLINEVVYFSRNSSTPSPGTTVTQTVTTTQAVHSTATCPTPTPSPVPTVTEYLTVTPTVTTTQVVHSTATCPTPTLSPVPTVTEYTCPTLTPGILRNCQEFHSNGSSQSGVYTIRPDCLAPFDVYCDMDTDGGGWEVLQRRQDGSVDFYRNWDNYVAGFGDLSGEFWLGLDKINRLTEVSSSELWVDLVDFENETRYANYRIFHVGNASTKYTLTVGGYNGIARDSLSYQNGGQFTTYDQDNDVSYLQCAVAHQGAWWYTDCGQGDFYMSNLNGEYLRGDDSTETGIFWRGDFTGQVRKYVYSLKFTEMKVRPLPY